VVVVVVRQLLQQTVELEVMVEMELEALVEQVKVQEESVEMGLLLVVTQVNLELYLGEVVVVEVIIPPPEQELVEQLVLHIPV
jgi:hypothetical protein